MAHKQQNHVSDHWSLHSTHTRCCLSVKQLPTSQKIIACVVDRQSLLLAVSARLNLDNGWAIWQLIHLSDHWSFLNLISLAHCPATEAAISTKPGMLSWLEQTFVFMQKRYCRAVVACPKQLSSQQWLLTVCTLRYFHFTHRRPTGSPKVSVAKRKKTKWKGTVLWPTHHHDQLFLHCCMYLIVSSLWK